MHAESGDTCSPDIHGVSVARAFDDFGGDVAEREVSCLPGKRRSFAL